MSEETTSAAATEVPERNAVAISIKDKSKRAVCREVLSLCGRYVVTVDPAWDGDGYIVLFSKAVLPKVWPHYPVCDRWAYPLEEQAGILAYAELEDGEGLLDLREDRLVRLLTKTHDIGSVADVMFCVFAPGPETEEATGESGGAPTTETLAGMNMIGMGEMPILVNRPYSMSTEHSLVLFGGVTGAKGDKGDTGPKGDTGDTGPMADIFIGSVEAGAQPAVTITETTRDGHVAYRLDFTLQKGDKGDNGVAGSTGAQGPQGPHGPQGQKGPKGDTGAKGDPGITEEQIATLFGSGTSGDEGVVGQVNDLASSVSGLWGTMDTKADLVDGKVPASQLPSYIDDVIEGYLYSDEFYEDSSHQTKITGEAGKIYVDKTTGAGNKCYRWSGTAYIEVSPAPTVTVGSQRQLQQKWTITPATVDGKALSIVIEPSGSDPSGEVNRWDAYLVAEWTSGYLDRIEDVGQYPTSLSFSYGGSTISASRTEYAAIAKLLLLGHEFAPAGNFLDLQDIRARLAASEAEAEALRHGKQDALSAQQLANIADVPNKANAADLRYSLNTATVTPGSSVWTANYSQIYDMHGELVDVSLPEWGTYPTSEGEATGWFWPNPDVVYELLSEDESATSLTAYWQGYNGEESISYTINFTKTTTPATVTNVKDRAINAIALSGDATLEIPSQVSGKSRDFLLSVANSGSSNATVTVSGAVLIDSAMNAVTLVAKPSAITTWRLTEMVNGSETLIPATFIVTGANQLSLLDVIDPANATASGKAADALATKNALAAKQDALTAQQLANIAAVPGKANLAANPTAGHLAALDANGNPTDSGKTPADFATAAQGGKADDVFGLFEEVPGSALPALRLTGFRVPWGNAGYIEFVNGGMHFYHPAGQGSAGVDYTTAWPFKSGTFATTGDIPNVSAKANDAAIAPEFDASASYAVGDIVMYNGARYKCTTAHSGAWAAADFAAESVQEAMDAGGGEVKPTRIYNESGTDALDDKGQLFKSSVSGNYWTVGTNKIFVYEGIVSGQYRWKLNNYDYLRYNPTNGKISEYYYYISWEENIIGTVQTGLDPTQGDEIPSLPNAQLYAGQGANFTSLASTMESTPYAHLALESLPDRTWAAGTWAVGDLVKYDGKAYRCKAATTSSDTTAPSSDTTHWDEIPVLAQKANAADLRYSFNTATVASGTTPTVTNVLDRAINAVAVTVPTATLSLTFPAATSGKARDFGVRLTVASGVTTAPEIALPQGVICENADGAVPEIGADGATTLLYFTETASGVFLVKGEVVTAIS